MHRRLQWIAVLTGLVLASTALAQQTPTPPGRLIDIGGQLIHLNCTGSGSPTVLLESGTGDFSIIWSLVQPRVSAFARVCSYDRAGYAWSQPGHRPRTFAQLALELRTALRRSKVPPPYLMVGQSYGGLVIRGFARDYPAEVVGMVMVDAVHEDQRTVYGGQAHRIRESARGRTFPAPRIALDQETTAGYKDSLPHREDPLEAPLDRLPPEVQPTWKWAASLPVSSASQQAELEWSPEELARFHAERVNHRGTLENLPLIVLARTEGGYPAGMEASPEELEQERRRLQADLAALSTRGELRFAARAGHNLHLEDPDLVVDAIRQVFKTIHRR